MSGSWRIVPVIAALVFANLVQSAELNVYSSRKDALIAPLLYKFTEETGIDVNLITGKSDALLSRIKAEGQLTPADVFITVDAGRLHRAKKAGILSAISSGLVDKRVPPHFRDIDGMWVALTIRARPIFYRKGNVDPSEIAQYEDLAENQWKDRICVRSSNSIYNQSLTASMIEAEGEKVTENWVRGLIANLARKPAGGDTDQLKAVGAGQCDLAIANTYYLGRLLTSKNPNDQALAKKLGVIWPNQKDRGTHVNVSGFGITKHAKNRDEALRLLTFMLSDEAQSYYAEINHEYPVVVSAERSKVISGFGDFKMDTVNLSILGERNSQAVRLMDRGGWR